MESVHVIVCVLNYEESKRRRDKTMNGWREGEKDHMIEIEKECWN